MLENEATQLARGCAGAAGQQYIPRFVEILARLDYNQPVQPVSGKQK